MVSIDLPGVWIVLQRVHLLPRLMRLGYVSSRTSLVAVGGNRFGVRVQHTELSKSLNVISSRFGLPGLGGGPWPSQFRIGGMDLQHTSLCCSRRTSKGFGTSPTPLLMEPTCYTTLPSETTHSPSFSCLKMPKTGSAKSSVT